MSKFQPIIKDLIQFYYKECEQGAGGGCHIALDDGNLEDHHLLYCTQCCEETQDWLGYLIACTLLEFTIEEREKMYDNYWDIKPWGK